MTTQRYGDHRPTQFDAHITIDTEDGSTREDWLIAPCIRTRDSGCLDESNFAACLELLGGESETCEVRRFGHWGPGWYEIILVAPGRKGEVEAIDDRLDGYPVLDEDDLGERECEAEQEAWDSHGKREFAWELARGLSMTEYASARLEAAPWLWDVYRDVGGECHGDGSFYFYGIRQTTRDQLAAHIRAARKNHATR